MLIHELTTQPKKVNESLSSFFGLNNPQVAQAWGQMGGALVQDLFARFSKDPRYANMTVAQRKLALERDQNIQDIANKKADEWNKYVTSLQTKNGARLTDQQYQAALLNWANPSLFNGKFANLDPVAKHQAQFHLDWIAKHRDNPAETKKMLTALISDETSRMIQVATDLQRAQAAIAQPTTQAPGAASAPVAGGAPKTGLPGAAEEQKFNQLVANALKAQA